MCSCGMGPTSTLKVRGSPEGLRWIGGLRVALLWVGSQAFGLCLIVLLDATSLVYFMGDD